MLAITNQITSLEMTNLTTNCEIEINLSNCNKLLIGAYYRPHTNDQLSIEELNLSLCKLKSQNSNVTIWLGGDFNAPGIDWQTLTLRNDYAYGSVHNSLIATTCDYGLTQLVTEPTRLNNMLDLFFTDHPSQITNINILPGTGDHDIVMITADIKPELTVQPSRKVFFYHKANWNTIKQNLFALANLFPLLTHYKW